LKSWAVPKGPSRDPAEKRLAMPLEDHPSEYADFEGIIPPDEYGAGTVIVWDRGTWTPESDDVHAAYRAGRLKFRLEGEKLRGGWALVRIRSRGGEKRESWLLMKERDAQAHPGEGDMLLERRPESVTSGRTLDDVAQGRRALRPASRRATGRQSGARKPGERKASVPRRARAAAAFPAWIEPE